MRATFAVLGAAVVALGAGAGLLVAQVVDWYGHPRSISSTEGLPVFRDAADSLVSYLPFAPGPAVALIGVGIVVVPIALLLAAARWRARVY